MLKKAAALLLVGVSLGTWIGCGTTASRYLYAAVPAASQIFAYREDPNSGILTALTGSPITAGTTVSSIAIHPSKKFLYAANAGTGNISLFTISSSGALTEVTPRTSAGTLPEFLVMDSAGSTLYVGNVASQNISVFSIDASSGALTASGSPILTGISLLNMKLSPSGSVLYVTGATGANFPGLIEAINVSTGDQVPGSPFLTGRDPEGLTIDSTGTYLYTANAQDNSISEFTISSTDGSLTELSGSPLGETYTAPRALLIDNSGKYLYVANGGSSNLSAYTIGSDGGLTLLSGSGPFTTSSQPSVIVSDPSGKYLFVGNQASGAGIQSFSLNTSTGALTSVATYTVGNTPKSIAVSQ